MIFNFCLFRFAKYRKDHSQPTSKCGMIGVLQKEDGYSLTEALMAVVTLSIASGIIASTQFYMNKRITDLSRKIEGNLDKTVANKVIIRDLQTSHVSFNNITPLDDSRKPFFEYIPDVPEKALTNPSRTLTLSSSATSPAEVVILLQDINLGNVLIYDPTAAYDIGDRTDVNQAATLTFKSVNKANFISNNRPEFWRVNRLLLFDTASLIRPISAQGTVDMMTAPRSSIFLGSVARDLSTLNQVNSLLSYTNTTHPETNTEIINADGFLRSVVSMGGGLPLIRVQAVKAIKYTVTKKTDALPARLIRSEFDPATQSFKRELVLADRVDSFTLIRPTITTRLINFSIKKLP